MNTPSPLAILVGLFGVIASNLFAANDTASTRMPREVSNFALIDQNGELHELRRLDGQAVVLFFTANGCPVAQRYATKLNALRKKYASDGVHVYMVNSHQGDDRRSIAAEMRALRTPHLPVLKDDTQGVARHLGVQRTGEVIAISTKDWTKFYHGAMDEQGVDGFSNPAASERYLQDALDQFLAGKPVTVTNNTARGTVIAFDGGNGPDSATVSYERDVVPILGNKCVHCHSPGNIGSWSMSGHRKVRSMARMIEEVILTRRMPPWDADPAFGKFRNDHSLTIPEAQTLLRWIHQGAPRGAGEDPLELLQKNLVPPVTWPLGQPDMVVKLPRPEEIPATGVLRYRYINVVADNPEDVWLGGIWVRPGNHRVVHHVILRLKEGGEKDDAGRNELIAAWAPGGAQGRYPAGSGKRLPANAKLVFEMHYTTIGSPQTDQTEIGFYLLKERPAKRFETVWVVNSTFRIEPGDADSKVQALFNFKRPATLHSVVPHMHLRGRTMKLELLFPDGRRETVASFPRYDFNWQLTYELAEPKLIPAGTWALATGSFDNSARNPANPDPKAVVNWGPQSFDEMFIGFYNVTWDLPPADIAANDE